MAVDDRDGQIIIIGLEIASRKPYKPYFPDLDERGTIIDA